MTLTVKLFARARDLAGADAVTLAVPARATVADLRRRLAEEVPALRELLSRCAIAVDGEFVDDSQAVRAGAEVAVIPPVSGG